MSDYYYKALGRGHYRPSEHVQGAWDPGEQHLAPVAGLIVHAIEDHEPRDDLSLARISFDVLGMIPLDETWIEVMTLRPGRTIELVEAVATVGERAVIRARAWRLSRQDSSPVSGGGPTPLPPPDAMTGSWNGNDHWGGGFIQSLEVRAHEENKPGRGRAWGRTDLPLVAGETVSPTAQFLAIADIANGVAVRALPTEWMFPNIDLTIHLVREPVPGWVGFDTTVTFGDDGIGLTSSWLHDVNGAVGRIEQILTVRPVG